MANLQRCEVVGVGVEAVDAEGVVRSTSPPEGAGDVGRDGRMMRGSVERL